MKMKWKAIALAGALTLVVAACGSDNNSSSGSSSNSASTTTTAPKQNVVQIAAANTDFTTLVSLVTKANLAATLSGPGPYTIFAPTNAAFAKIPAATLAAVGNNADVLKKVLTYHVVAGNVMAADVTKLPGVTTAAGAKVTTVEGAQFTVKATSDGKVTITDALGNTVNVVKTDIVGSNGVIHVIDGVLLPVAPPAG